MEINIAVACESCSVGKKTRRSVLSLLKNWRAFTHLVFVFVVYLQQPFAPQFEAFIFLFLLLHYKTLVRNIPSDASTFFTAFII